MTQSISDASMPQTKQEKDRARLRRKRENETPEERLARLQRAKAYRQTDAGKRARQKENAKRKKRR